MFHFRFRISNLIRNHKLQIGSKVSRTIRFPSGIFSSIRMVGQGEMDAPSADGKVQHAVQDEQLQGNVDSREMFSSG